MKGQTRSAENERDMEYFSRETVTKDSNVYRHRELIQWSGYEPWSKGDIQVVS